MTQTFCNRYRGFRRYTGTVTLKAHNYKQLHEALQRYSVTAHMWERTCGAKAVWIKKEVPGLPK